MPNSSIPDAPDHRKLIRTWIEEEEAREAAERPMVREALDTETVAALERAARALLKAPDRPSHEIQSELAASVTAGVRRAEERRERRKLPTQYDREQGSMKFARLIPPTDRLVSPSAIELRDDVFRPSTSGDGEAASGFHNQEGNPDVNRVENWSIWAYVWGSNGGDACWSALYWRYRIWVGSFDTSVQTDRRLVVAPMAVLSGYYDLFAMPFWFFAPTSKVFLRFWTGTWHWHYTGSSYEPEWSGWRRSFDIVSAETSNGNIHQDIAVPYPGTEVRTPATFDPPGVITQPNPVNNYGTVVPYDVVDFYARPQLCAQTTSAPSYARLDFSLIDVPFVRYSLETGYYL